MPSSGHHRGTVLVVGVDDGTLDAPGAVHALWYAARRGVPLVYIASDRDPAPRAAYPLLHRRRQLPPGPLYDWRRWWGTSATIADRRPAAVFRAERSRRGFKARIIRAIRRTHPRARVVCLGSNAAGDGYAFRDGGCAAAFLRRTIPSGRNLPCEATAPRSSLRVVDRFDGAQLLRR
jgi:hypothetical protein